MSRSEEELFLHDFKKTKRTFQLNLEINLKDQRWVYYLIIGSFGLLVLLNYALPNPYSIEKKPTYDIGYGFIGLFLVFFGVIFMYVALTLGDIKFWLLVIILSLIFLYFGLPMFGFKLW